jgi:hypothetical protein
MKNTDKIRAAGLVDALIQGTMVAMASASQVQAATAPEAASINLKTLSYQDYQPGMDRIDVDATALQVLAPFAGRWSFSGALVHDAISGASPKYHDKGLTEIVDTRNAWSASVSRYFAQDAITTGYSYSSEHDYVSRNWSLQNAWSTENQNTTFTAGVSRSADRILPNSIFLRDEREKNTTEFVVGLTQVMTRTDLAQITLRHSRGRGYFADQYKLYDLRPDSRDANTLLLRWNHYFEGNDTALHASYRFYTDSYDIDAHTLELEYVMNLPGAWQLSPLVRYYTQTAAAFYFDPVVNDPFADADTVGAPISVVYNRYIEGLSASMDQRLAEFGALTWGVKLQKHFNEHWSADIKYEDYGQRQSLSFGQGSPDLTNFGARSLQLGLDYRF